MLSSSMEGLSSYFRRSNAGDDGKTGLVRPAGYASIPSTERAPSPSTPAARRTFSSVCVSIVYGLVSGAMCAPVMMSFASIIFNDPFFRPFSASLVKLVLFSAAVHQLAYVCGSSMNFAVGQVQDAGLIFLSSMSERVVRLLWTGKGLEALMLNSHTLTSSEEAECVMCCALWVLSLATASLGLALILLGQMRLASLAQYLPVPVVGGYLAYIGFYCGQAGVAMMSGASSLATLSDWRHLLFNPHQRGALLRVVPGFGVCGAMKLLSHYCARVGASPTTRAMVVPAVIAMTIVAFYAIQYGIGGTLAEAREDGWVGKAAEKTSTKSQASTGWRSVEFLAPWRLLIPPNSAARDLVARGVLSVLPAMLPTWLAMVAVVSFSSSLDVAAIEMEIGRPLDYDGELQTVGVGNLVSGLLGGFSGSYIFSQTILNLRSRVADRLSGAALLVLELSLVFCFSSPPTSLAPTAAFGGLLLLIAEGLMSEWLLEARFRFSRPEYACIVGTFLLIHALGLEAGFAAGLVAAAVAFAVQYTREGGVSVQRSNVSRSVVMRNFEQRAVLSAAARRGETLTLKLDGFVFFGAAAKLLAKMRQLLDASDRHNPLLIKRSFVGASTRDEPRWIIVHAPNFTGVDATAVRACFQPLQQIVRARGWTLLFAGLRPSVKEALRLHGVELEDDVTCFETLDAALEYAEEGILDAFSSSKKEWAIPADALEEEEIPTRRRTASYAEDPTLGLRKIISDYVIARALNSRGHQSDYELGRVGSIRDRSDSHDDNPTTVDTMGPEETLQAMSASLGRYFVRQEVEAEFTFFGIGESAATLFFVESGTVDLKLPTGQRIQRIKPGGIFGELNFFLCRRSFFSATAVGSCVVWNLKRAAADELKTSEPNFFLLLQSALLKSISLQVEDSVLMMDIG